MSGDGLLLAVCAAFCAAMLGLIVWATILTF